MRSFMIGWVVKPWLLIDSPTSVRILYLRICASSSLFLLFFSFLHGKSLFWLSSSRKETQSLLLIGILPCFPLIQLLSLLLHLWKVCSLFMHLWEFSLFMALKIGRLVLMTLICGKKLQLESILPAFMDKKEWLSYIRKLKIRISCIAFWVAKRVL